MSDKKSKKLDIIVPIALGGVGINTDDVINSIAFMRREYGFESVALVTPGNGVRSTGYPSRDELRQCAEAFRTVREAVLPLGVSCGWFVSGTLKTGLSDGSTPITSPDGTEHGFANCPADPAYIRRYSEDVGMFCSVARPDFLYLEDDYAIAAASYHGCFCRHHLALFAERTGIKRSREELASAILSGQDIELIREWKKLTRDTLVDFAKAVRAEIDKVDPHIPAGLMQSGQEDVDGDFTEAVARALAGSVNIPSARFFGTYYCGFEMKNIPIEVFHAVYDKQHIKGDFKFIHESDTYPQSRFFTAGRNMKALMTIMYSYGFDGSIYQAAQQVQDSLCEETAYGKMYREQIKKFNALYEVSSECDATGVGLMYDPFINTYYETKSGRMPLWVKTLGAFGIPYTTTNAGVTFIDKRQAAHLPEDEIMRLLSGGLFLDGEAAKILCERGYSEYIGVKLTDDVAGFGKLRFDLNAAERICDGFIPESEARTMAPAFCYAPSGNGVLLFTEITDPGCEVITELVDRMGNVVTPAMTRFCNRLGGKVVVMSTTLDGNGSQSLFNYRRQRLLQSLILWCGADIAFVKEAPYVNTVMNVPKSTEKGFSGSLTLTNLCDDGLDCVTVHLPTCWRGRELQILDTDGSWRKAKYRVSGEDVIIEEYLDYADSLVIKII